MRSLILVVVGLTLAACTTAPPPEPLSAKDVLADDQARAQTEADLAQTQAEHDRLIQEPLAAFRQDPRCDSSNLNEATLHAHARLEAIASLNSPSEAAVRGGALALDVADAAREAGCRVVAEDLYYRVLRTYVGSAYSGLWARAQMGLTRL